MRHFEDATKPDAVCLLQRSLYGLKQSARCWNKALDDYLKEQKYVQSNADSCIYVKNVDSKMVLLSLYVDDLLIASNDLANLQREKHLLKQVFEMTDLGEVNYILGMLVKRDRVHKRLVISQELYVRDMLEKFGMAECKPIGTPLDVNVSFEPLRNDEDTYDKERYQSAIGSLLYVSMGTRPDISQAVGAFSHFVSRPGIQHWRSVQRVLRYLKGTMGHGILYSRDEKGAIALAKNPIEHQRTKHIDIDSISFGRRSQVEKWRLSTAR